MLTQELFRYKLAHKILVGGALGNHDITAEAQGSFAAGSVGQRHCAGAQHILRFHPTACSLIAHGQSTGFERVASAGVVGEGSDRVDALLDALLPVGYDSPELVVVNIIGHTVIQRDIALDASQRGGNDGQQVVAKLNGSALLGHITVSIADGQLLGEFIEFIPVLGLEAVALLIHQTSCLEHIHVAADGIDFLNDGKRYLAALYLAIFQNAVAELILGYIVEEVQILIKVADKAFCIKLLGKFHTAVDEDDIHIGGILHPVEGVGGQHTGICIGDDFHVYIGMILHESCRGILQEDLGDLPAFCGDPQLAAFPGSGLVVFGLVVLSLAVCGRFGLLVVCSILLPICSGSGASYHGQQHQSGQQHRQKFTHVFFLRLFLS